MSDAAPTSRGWTPHRPKVSTHTRQRILAGATACYLCGINPPTEVDHIHPIAFGGQHHASNLAAICGVCHKAKSRSERLTGLQRWRDTTPKQRRPLSRHPGADRWG